MTVEVALALSVEMLEVYTENATSPLPTDVATANADGTITVPLMYEDPTTATWQLIEGIEIAITPDMFNGLVLDATRPRGCWARRSPGWSCDQEGSASSPKHRRSHRNSRLQPRVSAD